MYTYNYIYSCTYVCIYVHVYINMYVYIHIYVCIYRGDQLLVAGHGEREACSLTQQRHVYSLVYSIRIRHSLVCFVAGL